MGRWRIRISPQQLAVLRQEEEFAELLTLARLANSLRFAIGPAFTTSEGIVGERQRIASFLLTAATASEALHTLKRMKKHFRELPAYKELVAPLLGDANVTDLRGRVLKWLRDKAVFHHDKDVVPVGLADLEGTWTFAEADTDSFMDLSYPLADFVVIRAVLNEFDTEYGLVDAFEDVLSKTLQLATSLIAACDTLIGQALSMRGFTVEGDG
jgi:hypothetical protein